MSSGTYEICLLHETGYSQACLSPRRGLASVAERYGSRGLRASEKLADCGETCGEGRLPVAQTASPGGLHPMHGEASKPVRCGNPTLGRFDSGAAPLGRLRLVQAVFNLLLRYSRPLMFVRWNPLESARNWRTLAHILAHSSPTRDRECELLAFCPECWQREFVAGKEEGPPERAFRRCSSRGSLGADHFLVRSPTSART